MKQTKYIIGLLLLVAGLVNYRSTAGNPHAEPANVVLECWGFEGITPQVAVPGLYVYRCSTSTGVPAVPHYWSGQPMKNLSEALVLYRLLGFRISHISPDGRFVLLEK